MMDEMKVSSFDLKNNFEKLSVQYDNNPSFEINPKIVDEYNKQLGNKPNKSKKPSSKTKLNLLIEQNDEDENEESISLSDIHNSESLQRAIDLMLKRLKPIANEYAIKEAHEYTQVLPEQFYQPGSHLLNRKVAFALKNTDERLF
jgi:hypothetical protein